MKYYWKKSTKNIYGTGLYTLHAVLDNNDCVIAAFTQNKEDDSTYYFSTGVFSVEDNTIVADSPEDMKKWIENVLIEHWEDEIEHLKNQIADFTEQLNKEER